MLYKKSCSKKAISGKMPGRMFLSLQLYLYFYTKEIQPSSAATLYNIFKKQLKLKVMI